MKLLKTGIAGLDEFLTGGLPPKILLLVGLPGAGNEVFARQIAYTRAKQIGITYFTVNDPARQRERRYGRLQLGFGHRWKKMATGSSST